MGSVFVPRWTARCRDRHGLFALVAAIATMLLLTPARPAGAMMAPQFGPPFTNADHFDRLVGQDRLVMYGILIGVQDSAGRAIPWQIATVAADRVLVGPAVRGPVRVLVPGWRQMRGRLRRQARSSDRDVLVTAANVQGKWILADEFEKPFDGRMSDVLGSDSYSDGPANPYDGAGRLVHQSGIVPLRCVDRPGFEHEIAEAINRRQIESLVMASTLIVVGRLESPFMHIDDGTELQTLAIDSVLAGTRPRAPVRLPFDTRAGIGGATPQTGIWFLRPAKPDGWQLVHRVRGMIPLRPGPRPMEPGDPAALIARIRSLEANRRWR